MTDRLPQSSWTPAEIAERVSDRDQDALPWRRTHRLVIDLEAHEREVAKRDSWLTAYRSAIEDAIEILRRDNDEARTT